jgi:hypothetical protein
MTSYCDFSDLPVQSCAHCQGFDTTTKTRSRNVFEASFPSRCPACSDAIVEGDTITSAEVGYVHAECG